MDNYSPIKSPKNHSFTELKTPTKDQSGVARTAHQHARTLNSHLENWNRAHLKTIPVCRNIATLKLYDLIEDAIPPKVKLLTDSLVQATNAMKDVIDGLDIITRQFEALKSLDRSGETVLHSWNIEQLWECTKKINSMYHKEYLLKLSVTENIAHCRDKHLTELYASSWEFQPYLDTNEIAFFIAETGLPTGLR